MSPQWTCPAPGCETKLPPDSPNRAEHFHREHRPEDFGLAPEGELPA